MCNIVSTLNAEMQRDEAFSLHELTNEYVLPHNILTRLCHEIRLPLTVLILKTCDNVS